MATAWFTGADPGPRVLVQVGASDEDAALEPLVLDADAPIGRVSVAVLDSEGSPQSDPEILVSWIGVDTEGAVLRLARLAGDGSIREILDVGRRTGQRGEGVPQLCASGSRAWLVWTELSEPPRVRGVTLTRSPSP